MFCHQCGKEVTEDAVFCQFCGTKLIQEKKEAVVQQANNSSHSTENVEKGPWRLLAAFGLALGILTICTFYTIVFGIMCGIPGIILSALGMRSEVENSKAIAGLILSIIGTILSICFPLLLFLAAI